MPLRFLQHLRQNAIAYFALFLAVGAGGGYAIAATRSQTITVCVDKRTGVMHLHHGGKCGRGQTKLSWNQQGLTGRPGQQGPPGQAPPSAWAVVANNGATSIGTGIAVTHVATGTYQVTVTAQACAGKANAPVIQVLDANPPGGQVSGVFPTAWATVAASAMPFTVYTGDVIGGQFTPSDHAFDLQDVCGS